MVFDSSPAKADLAFLLVQAEAHCQHHNCSATIVTNTGGSPGVQLLPLRRMAGGDNKHRRGSKQHECSSSSSSSSSSDGRLLVVTLATSLRQASLMLRSASQHLYTVIVLTMDRGEDFLAKVRRLEAFARVQCPRTILLLTDAYDSFFAAPATTTLRRFHQMRNAIVFSTERSATLAQAIITHGLPCCMCCCSCAAAIA